MHDEYEKSKTPEGNETSSSNSEDEEQQESVADPAVCVRQRRTKGNRCQLVIASLLQNNISYNAQPTSLKKQKKLSCFFCP